MKITKVETIRSEDRSYCWILITTDAGYVGVGETYHRADPAEIVIHEFARAHLLGQNRRISRRSGIGCIAAHLFTD